MAKTTETILSSQSRKEKDITPKTEAVPVVPSSSFLREVEETSGEKVSLCYQCKKCSSGCPVTFAMDYLPHVVLRMAQVGLRDRVLGSATIWICASCETCTTRCPNEIDVAGVMDTLRRMALKADVSGVAKLPPAARDIAGFHSAFLKSIKTGGRVHEPEMIGRYLLKTSLWAKLRSGWLLKEAKLGWEMFRRGKLRLVPHRMHRTGEIRELFQRSER